jgi:hypothetical protein
VRALVVEDERRLAAGLRNGLEAEGFAVDVVVLDIMLPARDSDTDPGTASSRPALRTATSRR